MLWQVTTAPAVEPVSLANMKLHLRVDSTDDNDLITSLIVASRQWCEDYEGRSYITQTITAKIDRFSDEIIIPRPKLQSVTAIKYIDTSGDEQTLDSGIYDVDIYREPGRITRGYNQNWANYRGDVNGIEIIYIAGYGDASTDVPDRTIAAIKLLCGHLFEHRESTSELSLKEIPMGVTSLLNSKMRTV